MRKEEFLSELKDKLTGLKSEDLGERLAFYSEIIDGRMENGETELEAVAGLGSVDDVVAQIMSEIPLSKLVREKVRPVGTIPPWVIVLLVLLFPVWFPLLIAALTVVLSLFVALWVIVGAVFVVDLALIIAAVFSTLAAFPVFLTGNRFMALFLLGAGLACFGMTILVFLLGTLVTKCALWLSRSAVFGIKSLFIGKEEPWNA